MAQPECARSAGRMAQGLRSGENPARWRGHLDQLLGAPHNGQGGQFTTFIVFLPRRRDISLRGMPSCRVSADPRTSWISSMDAAMPPVVSSQRRRCARVIRVDVALGRAAGSRHRALGQREVGAILVRASPDDNVHAYRKSRIVCLGPGLPCCRNHSDRQNRQSQNAHRNPLRNRHNIGARIDLSQFTFSRRACVGVVREIQTVRLLQSGRNLRLVNVRC